MKTYAFSRKSRLRLKKNFQAVFSAENKTNAGELIAWHQQAGGLLKLGLMVSKKTGGAVRRNRLKRLLREAFRLSQDKMKKGVRLIIYPRAGCQIDSLSDACRALDKLRRKAKLFKE